jgi:hypothetical protein
MGIELTTTMGIPLLGLNANSKVKLTGNQCPDAAGKGRSRHRALIQWPGRQFRLGYL